MIRIAIADDHQIFIDGLRSLLEGQEDISIVTTALTGTELLTKLKAFETDIVLMDINMPEMNGIDATALIRKHHPKTKVLILSMYRSKEFINGVNRSGAAGYLIKNTGLTELLTAIRSVHEGKSFFNDQLATLDDTDAYAEHENLTLSKRELEITRLLAKGLTAPAIGEKLFISHYTVETHRKNLLNKLQLKNTAELIKYAAQLGLLDEE